MSPLAIAAIGAVTTVAGTVAQVGQQRKAAALSREQQALATRKSRRQAIRASQIQRAQSVASAQGAGVLQGSGAQGGIGALSSQLGSEFGFSTQMSGLSGDIGRAQSRANTFGSVAGLGGSLFNFGVNQGADFSNLFGSSPKPTSPAQAGLAPSMSLRPVARSF